MDKDGQVLSVSGRNTNSGKTIYDIAFSDGQKYTTFEASLAQRAQALAGQPVSLRFEVKQNGNFTNYNAKDIAPQGQLPPDPNAGLIPGAAGGVAGGIPMQGAPIPITNGGGGGSNFDPATVARIARSTGLSAAATFLAGKYNGVGDEAGGPKVTDVLEVAQLFADFIINGTGPAGQSYAQPPATPAEVASAVNAEVPGGVQVGVGGEAQEAAAPTVKKDLPW